MAGRGRRVMGIGDGSNGSSGADSGSFLKPPGLRRGGEGWRGSYPLPPVIGHAAADRESVRIHAESGQNPNIDATRSFDLSYRRAACTQSPRQCNENVKNPCREYGGGAGKRVAFVAGGGVSKVSAGKTGGSGKRPDGRGCGRYMGAVACYGRSTFVQHE